MHWYVNGRNLTHDKDKKGGMYNFLYNHIKCGSTTGYIRILNKKLTKKKIQENSQGLLFQVKLSLRSLHVTILMAS